MSRSRTDVPTAPGPAGRTTGPPGKAAAEGRCPSPSRDYSGLVFPPGHVVGRSAAMDRVYRELQAAAGSPFPILLAGETGTGKEHLARLVHLSSPRADRPFVAINCAALPAELAEAELFGVEDGVATGVRRRRGAFRDADAGTLFLDEVAEMEGRLQSKLLRALQEGEVRPVGGRPEAVDVRVVAATNADLDRRRAAGEFRDDLYYRLAGFVVRVPPLRHREGDLEPLAERLAAGLAAQIGKRLEPLPDEVLAHLAAYRWPGNVRQLEHELRRLVCLAPQDGAVRAADLSQEVRHGDIGRGLAAGGEAGGGVAPLGTGPLAGEVDGLELAVHVAHLEERLIRRALARTQGSIAPAARLLGISRNGFKLKCQRLGVRI